MDPSTLADARKAIEDNFMVSSAQVLERITLPKTGAGGQKYEWRPTGYEYPCKAIFRPVDIGERLVGDKLTSIAHYTIKLPWDAEVNENHRLVVEDTTYHVAATNGNQTE